MLILSRKAGQSIRIDDNVELIVTNVSGNRVTVGIRAPRETRILRGELEVFPDVRGNPDEKAV